MEVGRAFSIFACLLFSLQICDAVICPTREHPDPGYFHLEGNKECSGACAYVDCGDVMTPDSAAIELYGCEDVINECRKYDNTVLKDEFEFISQHNPNALMYKNDFFRYISGCGGEKEGHKCLQKKVSDFFNEVSENDLKGRKGLFWHSSDDGVKGNGSLGRGNSNGGGGTNNGNTNNGGGTNNGNTNGGDASGDNTNGNSEGTSASNSQNGTLKFGAIIAIGWILVAAWIH